MRDSAWSGPVLAGALVGSAALLVVLATQIEVNPPPKSEIVVEHRTCSGDDVETLRNRIARIQRRMMEATLDPRPRSASELELDGWHTEEILKARRQLEGCGAEVVAIHVDLCEGFDVADAQREIAWIQEVRASFRRQWYPRAELARLEMLTGMCGLTGARTWPSPPEPWVEQDRAEERAFLHGPIEVSATHSP